VQVDPIKPTLKAPGTKLLKVISDEPLSSVGFKINLRRYNTEIGQLTALQTLELNSNRLTSVPPELWNLNSLQTFDLSSNDLTSVPPALGRLTALQSLNLGFNELTSVPAELGRAVQADIIKTGI